MVKDGYQVIDETFYNARISPHGMNQDPGFQQNQTQWNALADTEGFIVTYPLGNNRMWDTSGMGDVKFVEAVYR